MNLNAITQFIAAINPLPRLLNLLPEKVARQVAVVLVTAGGVLILASETLLADASPGVAHIVTAVLAIFTALGIHGEVTPVKDPHLPGIFPPSQR